MSPRSSLNQRVEGLVYLPAQDNSEVGLVLLGSAVASDLSPVGGVLPALLDWFLAAPSSLTGFSGASF